MKKILALPLALALTVGIAAGSSAVAQNDSSNPGHNSLADEINFTPTQQDRDEFRTRFEGMSDDERATMEQDCGIIRNDPGSASEAEQRNCALMELEQVDSSTD